MADLRINNQTVPRQEADDAPSPDEVAEAVVSVAEQAPELHAEDVLDHDNVTPAELDATLGSATRLRLPEREVLERARSAYVSDTPMRLEPTGGLVDPPRLGDGETLQVDPPRLEPHYGVPREAHPAIGELVPEEPASDDLHWTLGRLHDVREGRLSADGFLTALGEREVRDLYDEPVLARVRDLVDSADVRLPNPGDPWAQSEAERQAIDEAMVVTAAAVAARGGYGDDDVRARFLTLMDAHPAVAEMAAGQVEMLYAGHPFPGELYEDGRVAEEQDGAPYLRMTSPERRAAALGLMRRAAALDDEVFRFSTNAAVSLLQTVDPMDGARGFIARDEHLPVAEEALRTVLDRNAFNATELDPGAGTLIDYAGRIAAHASRHPPGSPQHAEAVRAMDHFVGVLAEYGEQFDSIDDAPGPAGDPAYASVVRSVREHFLGSGARRPAIALADVPRALSLFQRVPDARTGELLAQGGPAAEAMSHRVLMEVPGALQTRVAESLGSSALAEDTTHDDPDRAIRALAPGITDAEIAAVRAGSGLSAHEVAALLENVALYNALPEPERARLFARAGVELSGPPPPVLPDTLLAAAARGELEDSPVARVIDPRSDAPPLRDRVLELRDELLRSEFYALTELEDAVEAYDGDLDRLVQDIERGIELPFTSIGGGLLTPLILARVVQWRGQAAAVDALADSDRTRGVAEAALAEVERRTRQVEAALEVQAISELRREGTPEGLAAADFLTARLQTGVPLASIAPHLAGTHDGPFTSRVTPALGESALERLEDETDEQFAARIAEQRARVLSGLTTATSDLEVDAWRTSLDSVDPDFRRVWRDLHALRDLDFFATVQSADGDRFTHLADYMEERSEPLREIFAAPLPAARVDALRDALETALDAPDLAERQRQVLSERLALVEQYDALIHDPRSGAAHLVDPDNFERSFENWLVEEGPAMAGGIAVGVAAGLAASSVVGSGAAPGLAVASARLIGTAAAISAGYHVGYNAADLTLGTGADGAIWGPALRGEITTDEAVSGATREIVTGTLFGAAAMGTTSLVLRNLERASTSVLSRWGANDVNRLRSMMDTARLGNAPVSGALWNRYVTEIGEEGGQELAQLAVQSAAQAALAADPNNAALTFGVAVMTEAAFGARRSWRAANTAALQNLGLSESHRGRVFELEGSASDLPIFADRLRGAGAHVERVAPDVLMFSGPDGESPAFVTTRSTVAGPFGTAALADAVTANDPAAIPALRAAARVGRVESFGSLSTAIPERARVPARELMDAVRAGDVGVADVTRLLDAQGTRYRVENGEVVIEPLRRSFGGTSLNHLAARVDGRFDGARVVVDPDLLADGEVTGYTDVDANELGLSLRGLLTGRQTFVETHETHAHLRDVYRHGGALDVRVSSLDGAPLTSQFESGPYAREFTLQDLLGAAHTARTLTTGAVRLEAGETVSVEHAEQLGEAADAGIAVATQSRELAASAVEALRSGTPLTVVDTNDGHAVSFDTDDGRRFNLRVDGEGLPVEEAARDAAIRARLTERLAQIEERAHALRGDFVRMALEVDAGNWPEAHRFATAAHRYAARQSAWVGDVPERALAIDAAGWARVRVGPREGESTVDDHIDPYTIADSPVSFSGVLRRTEELGALVANGGAPDQLARIAADASDRARHASENAGAALDAVNAGRFELDGHVVTIRYESGEYGTRTMSVDLSGTGVVDAQGAEAELQRRLRLLTVTADGVHTRAERLANLVNRTPPVPAEEVQALASELQRVANSDFGAPISGWNATTEIGTRSDVRVAAYPTAVRFAESGLDPALVQSGLAGLSQVSRLGVPGYVFDPLSGRAVLDGDADDRAGYEREVTALRWINSVPRERAASMVEQLRDADPGQWESFVSHIGALRPLDVRALEGDFAPGVSNREAAAFAILAGHSVRRTGQPESVRDGPFAPLAPLLANGGNPFPGFPDATLSVLRDHVGPGDLVEAMRNATPPNYAHNGLPLVANASAPELYDLARTARPEWERARRIEGRVEDSPFWPLFQNAHRSTMIDAEGGPIYPYDAAIVTTEGQNLSHPHFSGQSPIHGWFCLGAAERAVEYLEDNGGTYAFVVGSSTELSENVDRAWVVHAFPIAPIVERRPGPDGVERDHLALVYMDPHLFMSQPVVIRPGEPFAPGPEHTVVRGRREESIRQILAGDPPVTGETIWTRLEVIPNPDGSPSLVDENGALRVDDDGNPIFEGQLRVVGEAYEFWGEPDQYRPRRFQWNVERLENGDTVIASLNTGAMRTRAVKAVGEDGVPRIELSATPGPDGTLTIQGAELTRDPALREAIVELSGATMRPRGLELTFYEDGQPNPRTLEVLDRLAPYFGFADRPEAFRTYLMDFAATEITIDPDEYPETGSIPRRWAPVRIPTAPRQP